MRKSIIRASALLALSALVSACGPSLAEIRREHCRSLVEIVEERRDQVDFSEETIRVYDECVERLS